MNEEELMLPEACAAFRAELGALLDGARSDTAREEVERHLAGCADCRAELTLLRIVKRAVQALSRPLPPEATRYRLRAEVARDTAIGPGRQSGTRWSRVLPPGGSRREEATGIAARGEAAPRVVRFSWLTSAGKTIFTQWIQETDGSRR